MCFLVKRAEEIEHKGTVALVGQNFVRVDIIVNEACGSCAARKSCAMGSSEKREITIFTPDAAQYSVGEEVEVQAKRTIGVMAVLLCYVVPLSVLLGALVVSELCGIADGISALVALGAMALYFGVLAMLRTHISRKVTFQIIKK